MDDKVKVSVLGFSFNQARTGAYGLVLAEDDGVRRLMVIVGTPEAQAIAFKLQNTPPPRPLTHDLIQSIMSEFNLTLMEVNIYKYVDGIFYSKLVMENQGRISEVESRTSDAVGIALRTNSPIYTTEQIMQEFSVVFKEGEGEGEAENDKKNAIKSQVGIPFDYTSLSPSELSAMLKDALKGENYEQASILRDEINKKKKTDSNR